MLTNQDSLLQEAGRQFLISRNLLSLLLWIYLVPSIVPLYLSSLPATAAPRSQPEFIAILYALASGQSLPIPPNPLQDALPDLQAGLSYLFWKMFRC